MNLNERLNMVIKHNKKASPEQLKKIIKSDFFYLINNYFEASFDDVIVEINEKDGEYKINISCKGDRVKFARVLPE
ncbi:MAG: hypothetical protein E7374_03070 [Clostridiales bacterium]|nr:hypothetical protein [Clostridiales bacterium]